VLLNLAAMVGEALPRGGTVALGGEEQAAGYEIVVRGEGAKLIFDPAVRAVLGGGMDLTSKSIGAYMVLQIVQRSGGALNISGAEEPFLLFGAQLPR
jgi:histidine phosphotransferase ChpT